MSKYNTDLDYVIIGIDISEEELEEIMAEADKIISENKRNIRDKESREILALAYLKKAQCRRKLETGFYTSDILYYDDLGLGLLKKTKKGIKKLLKKALELSPDMPEVLMQFGLLNGNSVFSNDKNYKSINFFSMAIQLKPDYAAAYFNRAMIFFNVSRTFLSDKQKYEDYSKINKINFKNAVTDLTEAIKIRPFDSLFHLNRAEFHSRLGEHKEAVEDFSDAIKYASDEIKERLNINPSFWNLRGKEYIESKEYGKAIDDFSETLRLKPKYDETLLLRGKAYYLSGEKDKAKADIEEYLNRKHKAADKANRNEIIKIVGVTPEEIL
ncbi:hypothetical protein R84B8_02196 [Treponema sp. R8-4-B8]